MPGIDFGSSAVIGDSTSDLLAGNRLGCLSFLVGDEGRLAHILAEHPDLRVECSAPTLLEVVARCLGLAGAS